METPFGEIPDRFVGDMSMADRHEYLEARAISRRRFLRGAALLGTAAMAGPVLWRRPALAASPPTAAHVAFGADPARQMVLSWATNEPVPGAFADVGPDASLGMRVAAESRAVAGTSTVYHHAVVDGLTPGQGYRYRLGHDGGSGKVLSFATAPATSQPFTFTAFGDQGVSAGAAAITSLAGAQKPAFHLHAGDLCYAYAAGSGNPPPPDTAVWDQWLGMISGVAATTPWMISLGNHEMESGYGPQGYDGVLGRFTLPAGGPAPAIYAFRYANLVVLALDANDASSELTHNRGWTAGRQDEWMRQTLAAARADERVDFVLAHFHHCVYCTNAVHASDGGVRSRWEPIFDEFAVDLVINGHNHCYERAHPLKGGQVTTEVAPGGESEAALHGTTYITAGGGGQAAYQTSLFPASYVTDDNGARVPEQAPWSATRYLNLSMLAADVTPAGADGVARMQLRALAADGTEIERVTLARRRAAATAPSTTTTPPPAATAVAGGTEGALPATGGDVERALPAVLTVAGAAAGAAVLRARANADAPPVNDG